MRALICIVLAGCVAPEVIVSTDGPPEDTAPPPADTAEDTDTGEIVKDPEPTYDTGRWNGSLHFEGDFFGNSCNEEVSEVGILLPKSDPLYNACSTCNAIYQLEPSTDAACALGAGFEIPLAQPTIRGVLFGDGFAMIYAIEDGRSSLLDADASYKKGWLRFSYTESVGGGIVDVTGDVRFPEE